MKTSIKHEGQKYVDEPVYLEPLPIAQAVARAFKRLIPPLHYGYERVFLRWMKPDGQGGLVPKC